MGRENTPVSGTAYKHDFPLPRLYQLDDSLQPIEVRYLGDAAEIEARIQGVVNQTKV